MDGYEMGERLELRGYQTECLEAIRQAFETAEAEDKRPRTLVVAATGTGKTIMFLAYIAKVLEEQPEARILIIAHRRELIHQPIEKARRFFPHLADRMGIVMGNEDQQDAQIVVGTVQTLAPNKRRYSRMVHLLQHGQFTHCVLDEAHHGTATTYENLLESLAPECKVLGMTATPMRTDGDGLRRVFSSCAYRFPIDAAISQGALVPFDALGFSLPIRAKDFEGIRETRDGWDATSMGDLLKAENVLEVVYEKWLGAGGGDRQTIIFTASVAQAHVTAEYFSHRGVAAEAVDGQTPKDQRDDILKRYAAGEIRVIANCQVLTEGFDAPETACICMVCPTRSDLAYVQKLGRGLRTAPGKTNCLVLDFAPAAQRNVIMAGDVLGQPKEVGSAMAKAEDAGLLISAMTMDLFGMVSSVDPTEVVVQWLDYMRNDTSLAWTMSGRIATASLSADHMLVIAMPDVERIAKGEKLKVSAPEKWAPRHQALLESVKATRLVLLSRMGMGGWRAETVGQYESDAQAQAEADRIAGRLADATLSARTKKWRDKPASDAQVRTLRRLRVAVPDGISRGRASQLIGDAIAREVTQEHIMEEDATL